MDSMILICLCIISTVTAFVWLCCVGAHHMTGCHVEDATIAGSNGGRLSGCICGPFVIKICCFN
jgi:hypothetical protein